MSKSEAKIQREFQEIIKRYGGIPFKHHSSQFTREGVPDLLCCIKGKFVAIEVKKPNTPHIKNCPVTNCITCPKFVKCSIASQKIVGQEIMSAGGIWAMIDNKEELEELLKSVI